MMNATTRQKKQKLKCKEIVQRWQNRLKKKTETERAGNSTHINTDRQSLPYNLDHSIYFMHIHRHRSTIIIQKLK